MKVKVGERVRIISYNMIGTVVDVDNTIVSVKIDKSAQRKKVNPEESEVILSTVYTYDTDVISLNLPTDPNWIDVWEKGAK